MHDGVQLYKPWAQRGKPLPRTCVEIPERVAGLNVPAVTVNVRHDGEHMLGCDGPFDALLAVAEHVQAAVVDTAYAVQDVLPVCALKKRDVANAKRAVGRFEEHGVALVAQKRVHAASADLDADLVAAFNKLAQHGYVFKCIYLAHG